MSRNDDLDRAQLLLMAEIDGELEPGDAEELQALCLERPELADERRRLARLKEITNMSRLSAPPDAAWDDYWRSTYRRLELAAGWILVTLGLLVLGGWGLWQAVSEMLSDPSVPEPVKWGLFALLFGGLILTISVVREKIFTYRNDPFEEVER